MKRLLLDTHAFIWFVANDVIPISKIIAKISRLIWAQALRPYRSIVRHCRGAMLAPLMLYEFLVLPLHHRDPFDRLLIAQAINNALAVISRDRAFDAYSIQRVWS